MATTLVVNPGSSSRKYALYEGVELALELRFENTDSGHEMCSVLAGTQQVCEAINQTEFAEASDRVKEEVDKYLFGKKGVREPDNVVIRVVAPGTDFQRHAVIDDAYVKRLQKLEEKAPLHVPVILREVKSARQNFKRSRIIAASDSAFHADMPSAARNYSIKASDAADHDIYRFGFHGLSVASIVRRIHAVIGQDPERMIVCHIGSGVSVTAVKNGKSVETSMGFAPATGLPMSSRAGDIDSAALLELMRVKNFNVPEAKMYVATNGGLIGVAGESDIRGLLDRRSQKDPTATEALDMFAYRLQKEIAAQTVALDGLDVLVLTATASVRSAELRRLIVGGLAHLGVQLSEDRNDLLVGKDGVLSVRNSAVKVVVMRTDEMREMAQVGDQFELPSA